MVCRFLASWWRDSPLHWADHFTKSDQTELFSAIHDCFALWNFPLVFRKCPPVDWNNYFLWFCQTELFITNQHIFCYCLIFGVGHSIKLQPFFSPSLSLSFNRKVLDFIEVNQLCIWNIFVISMCKNNMIIIKLALRSYLSCITPAGLFTMFLSGLLCVCMQSFNPRL